MVGMAEIRLACEAGATLMALGLGSCVAVCAFDRGARLAGMAHVVLPDSRAAAAGTPGKFADTAVPALIDALCAAGAARRTLVAVVVGGAQLFAFAGTGPRLDVGDRNATAVLDALRRAALPVVARDLGGAIGRTVHLHAGSGLVRVRTVGGLPRTLAVLGEARAARVQLAA